MAYAYLFKYIIIGDTGKRGEPGAGGASAGPCSPFPFPQCWRRRRGGCARGGGSPPLRPAPPEASARRSASGPAAVSGALAALPAASGGPGSGCHRGARALTLPPPAGGPRGLPCRAVPSVRAAAVPAPVAGAERPVKVSQRSVGGKRKTSSLFRFTRFLFF